MKTATIVINLSKEGHSVVRTGVSPAELALMVAEHHTNAGGKVVELTKDNKVVVEDVKDVTTTASQEKVRLLGRFAGNKVNAMFPGASPNLPDTFESAYQMGLGTNLPTSKLTEVKI